MTGDGSNMAEQRVLTEDEAFRLLAHLIATADLHTIEPPHYAGHRMVEGALPLIDAMIRDGDEQSRAWLRQFRQQLEDALAVRRTDRPTFEARLREAPGEIVRELKRRRARERGRGQRSGDAAQQEGSDGGAARQS